MRTSWTDLSTHWDLFWAQPWPSPHAFLSASQISVHRRRDNSKTSVVLVCGVIFHLCPHRPCMGQGLATLLDVWIILRAELCNPLQKECAGKTQRRTDMSRQHRARHHSVAAEIACGNTTSSQSQISLSKVSPPPPPSLTWSSFT